MALNDDAALREQAEAWLADDPDPASRAELTDLIAGVAPEPAAAALEELTDRGAVLAASA